LYTLDLQQRKFNAALIDPDLPVPTGVWGRNAFGDQARFSVYRNNVAVALREALSARYPVVEKLVGHQFFSLIARAYAMTHRPTTPVLIEYGLDFPSFVAGLEPAKNLPYLYDVARLENAWWLAYHAPDAESSDLSAFATLDPALLTMAHFTIHPSLQLIRSEWPVASIWAAHQADDAPRSPNQWSGECVVVLRAHEGVTLHPTHAAALVFAERLGEGATLICAADDALAIDPAFDAADALVQLAQMGAIVAVHSSCIEKTSS
jgi:hypothetical protein